MDGDLFGDGSSVDRGLRTFDEQRDGVDTDADDVVRYNERDEMFGISTSRVEDSVAWRQVLRGDVVQHVRARWVQALVEARVDVPRGRSVDTGEPVEVARRHVIQPAPGCYQYRPSSCVTITSC